MNSITIAWHKLRHRRSRPMSRDKADTLLLLFSCALVLLPYSFYLPSWITATCIIMILWRGWITFHGNRMPSRWLLLPIALLAMGGIYLDFRTYLGQEAGVATLVLLLTFKLLEMRASRDLFVVTFLAFFLLMTHFFVSQSIGTALMTIVSIVLLLTAQMSFQYTNAVPSLGKRLRLGTMIVALAIPLTIVLFLLFPRIQGPLWAMPGNQESARSGLSSTMSPGNISQLALSKEVAFRVRFNDNKLPPHNALYWRALVMGLYDGRTWQRDATQGRRTGESVTYRPDGPGFTYQITQEPNRQPWLFALERPASVPQLNGNRVRMTPDIQLMAARPITERIRYEVTSHPASALQADAPADSLRDWLSLPTGYHPRAIALAHRIVDDHATDAARIDAVLGMFRRQAFQYTLQPPLLEGDTVDNFLFTTRAGFCEHYASAFVVLMRAMQIPARVVTGYQGGEINPVDGYMTVRQSDAHAWAEVWLKDRGWVRVDPTAAVAPERIDRSTADTTGSAPVLGGLVNFNIGPNSWLHKMRFRWEAINNSWNQWVLNYTPDQQKDLLGALGFGTINWQKLLLLMMICGGVVMAMVASILLMHRPRVDPIDALYVTFCKRLARQGFARLNHEGPRAYGSRLQQTDALSAHTRHIAQQFLSRYEEYRYARNQTSERLVTRSTLHALLKQIR
ncbi:transglutaminase TgpA family protein [Oxalicibacterium faecigallinarum]|uniref:Protein-glutamine gamma-glutamyltransferase n=1 Tax=Oxalicibacterium faecigallinarum TaxID=573741 RepID=A0A8J3F5X3_9BURK|nr:DUF3488 and transglutaminase-like domain-containing protein [Oxalicibacterium faecigallinarum]GGI18396.1 protein-glutamine gamma-glutamyltransferase [Oxalicibacterium faecigallinarum]